MDCCFRTIAYIGPDMAPPIASVLAAGVGLLLIFSGRVVGGFKWVLRFIFGWSKRP